MEIIIAIIIGIFAYFFPTVLAYSKKKRSKASVFVLNFFLGWTLIGWIVALIWAVNKDEERIIEIRSENNISVADELEKLVSLKEKGVISEEEFENKKRSLLEK